MSTDEAEKEARRMKANLASRQSRLRRKMKLGQITVTDVKPSKSKKYADAPEIGSVYNMPNAGCRIMVLGKVDARGFVSTIRLDNGMKMNRHISDIRDTQKMVFMKVLKMALPKVETKNAA